MYHRIKHHVKNVVLIFLILLSLILVTQIWFGSFFSPNGHYDVMGGVKGFFNAPLSRMFGNSANGGFSQDIKSLLKPEKVVVTLSGRRSALYSGMEGYEELQAVSSDLMSDFLLGHTEVKSKETVEIDEYFSALKGRSFYVDYGNQIDSKLFSISVCGDSKTQFTSEISVVREYVISFNDTIFNTVSIYIRDYRTRGVTKYTVEYNKAKLEGPMTKYFSSYVSESAPSYSFELNFHQEVNSDGSVPKVIFTPLILIDLLPGDKAELYRENLLPFNQYGEMDAYTEQLILKAFHVNPMTMNKYIDLSNSKVFVENEGTLTIDPEGFIEYQTLEGNRGLNLSEDSSNPTYDAYTTTTLAVDFVSSLCGSFQKNMLDDLRISSDIVENPNRQGTYRISFDYYVEGVPVLQQDAESGEPIPAVELEIENGYLTFYRHCLKTYGFADTTSPMRPVINAVDDVVHELKPENSALTISKISFCYLDEGQERLSRKWEITVQGKNGIIILD